MLSETQVVANEMERVQPKLATLFDRDATFYSTIEKTPSEPVSARDMRVPLELRPGGLFGHYDPDGGDLGLGDGPTFDKGTVPIAHIKFGIQWTKKAEWATDDSRKAVLNTFRHLMGKSMAEFRRYCDSLCMTDGTGTLGTISVVSVNSPAGFDTITLGTDGYGARLLRFGQPINVYSSTLAVNRTLGAEKKIAFYDSPNKQIRIPTGTAGITAGDKIVVGGVSATPPASILGVPYHQNGNSTGTWLGFDRAVTPEVRGNRVNAAGALALPFPRLAFNKIGDRLGAENTKKVTAWMHPCQLQAYEELGQMVTVINKDSNKNQGLDLLYDQDNMRIAGVPIRTSFSWDKTRIDFIVNDAWGRTEMHPVGFYDVDGKKIFEVRGQSGGVAASQIFYIVASFQLFMSNPVAGAYVDGLTVPSGY